MAVFALSHTLTPAQLSAAREAFVARIDAAADREMRKSDVPGLPYRLIEASAYLAAAGVGAPACRGEEYFGWDLATSRQYLDGLAPHSAQQEIESGYAVLFEGRRAICASVLDVAQDLATAFEKFQQTVVDTQREAEEWEAQRAAAERRYWAKRDAMREAA